MSLPPNMSPTAFPIASRGPPPNKPPSGAPNIPFSLPRSDPAASNMVPSLLLLLPKRFTGFGPEDTGLGFSPVCNPADPKLK